MALAGALGAAIWLGAVAASGAAPKPCALPAGLAVMGLNEAGWRAYVVEDGGWRGVAGSDDARDPVMAPGGEAVAFFDPGGQLVWQDLRTGASRVLLQPDEQYAYIQPVFGVTPDLVIAVRLLDRRSRDSDLVQIDVATGRVSDLVPERSAQLEPELVGNSLLYSNIHCAAACTGLVQEIWLYDLARRQARQLTLNRAHSRDATLQPATGDLFYSSNLRGQFRIYRHSLAGGAPEPATSGEGLELWPEFDRAGLLWFVREQAAQSHLVCQSDSGEETHAPLPEGVTRLRDLEITYE